MVNEVNGNYECANLTIYTAALFPGNVLSIQERKGSYCMKRNQNLLPPILSLSFWLILNNCPQETNPPTAVKFDSSFWSYSLPALL